MRPLRPWLEGIKAQFIGRKGTKRPKPAAVIEDEFWIEEQDQPKANVPTKRRKY